VAILLRGGRGKRKEEEKRRERGRKGTGGEREREREESGGRRKEPVNGTENWRREGAREEGAERGGKANEGWKRRRKVAVEKCEACGARKVVSFFSPPLAVTTLSVLCSCQ